MSDAQLLLPQLDELRASFSVPPASEAAAKQLLKRARVLLRNADAAVDVTQAGPEALTT